VVEWDEHKPRGRGPIAATTVDGLVLDCGDCCARPQAALGCRVGGCAGCFNCKGNGAKLVYLSYM